MLSPRSDYPFSAVVGQDRLKKALLLAALEPALGGVLISGHRGSAKSTLARSLADLLNNKPFINCPLAVSEDRLLGSLNLEKVLANGQVQFLAGLLAKAHEGILYVDEINLLPDHIVDLLLDVSASGINYLERDGISHQHPARFILIGSMNPEEGHLRPQLLDRFGLFVDIKTNPDLALRLEIVASRLAFDDDPIAFQQRYAEQQVQLQDTLATAQQQLIHVKASSKIKIDIAQRCLQGNVEGVRADLALFRAAKAHTALRGGDVIETKDIDAVADFVLAHRQQEVAQESSQNKAPPTDPKATDSDNDNDQSLNQPNQNHSQNQTDQGDWGVMATETVGIALNRQLDPSDFIKRQEDLAQKKKQR
ncbi:MAG: ATP-binding protein [Cocleimonas sp.]|nr:ATP-binding protein [Cocleimonas sp.]